MLTIATRIFLAVSLLGILNATTEGIEATEVAKAVHFEEINTGKKEKEKSSWTCPICGQTFEKPEVHKCYNIRSDGTIEKP